jgi:DNA modification methylase
MSTAAVLANEQPFHVECTDVLSGLAILPDRCVHEVVTSPPYWGLRDYGLPPTIWGGDPHHRHRWGSLGPFCKCGAWRGCLGLEPTPQMFVAHLVQVFREVRRVLRDDGTLWLNLGDTFTSVGKWGGQSGWKHNRAYRSRRGLRSKHRDETEVNGPNRGCYDGFQQGDMAAIPWRVALALQQDGWILRRDIIWAKKTAMPESITGTQWVRCRRKTGRRIPVAQGGLSSWDMGEHSHSGAYSGAYRGEEKTVPEYEDCPGCKKCEATNGLRLRRGSGRPTTAHEYIFLFAKSGDYFYDLQAAKEKASGNAHSRGRGGTPKSAGVDMNTFGRPKQNGDYDLAVRDIVPSRNPRSFWLMSSEPTSEKHFAAYPTELVRRCIQPGTSDGGCCESCGAQHAPVIHKAASPQPVDYEGKNADQHEQHSHRRMLANMRAARKAGKGVSHDNPFPQAVIVGYRATCNCNAGVVPPIVLDPFCGTGTTGQVARDMGRRFIGIDQNPEYVKIANRKIPRPPRQRCDSPQRRNQCGSQIAMRTKLWSMRLACSFPKSCTCDGSPNCRCTTIDLACRCLLRWCAFR